MLKHVSSSNHKIASTTKNSTRFTQYQVYYTAYKTHAMATHHRGTGCPLERGLDIITEDPEHAYLNNGSTHSLDATVALGGPEAVGHPKTKYTMRRTD